MVTTTLDGCWQRWDGNPYNEVSQEERTWLKALNQAAFSGLEKKLEGRVKWYPVGTPAFMCHTAAGEAHASYVMTEWVHLPDASFDEQVTAAIERLSTLCCRDDVVVFYQLMAPVGALDHGNVPNRLHLGVRMRSLPAGHVPMV